jgi:hypothetical protein
METEAKYPKSYMTEAEREELRRAGVPRSTIICAESRAADRAKDGETAWEWLRFIPCPAHTAMALKKTRGAEYVRMRKLDLSAANARYGPGWLDE